jgi:diguanylate cyclase (GGDEF)-like protein/PAS domain S-box-containing protein
VVSVSTLVLPLPRGLSWSLAAPVVLAGVALSCLATVLFTDGTTLAGWSYLVVSVGGATVAWVGDRRRPQNRRGQVPWLPITLTCNAIGDVLWQSIDWATGSPPDVSVADVGWLASYVAMAGMALTGRISGRPRPGARMYAALDGCAALTVALLVVFQTSVTTTLADHGLPVLTRLTYIAYPVLDAALIGLMAWRLVLHGRVRPAIALLVLGMACWLGSDMSWMLLASADTVAGWLDVGWLLGVVLMALVPWVPQSRQEDPIADRGPGHGPWRMALNVAPFAAPALIEVVAWNNGTDVNPLPGLIVWGLLLVLSTIRTRLVSLDGLRAWSLVRSQARRSEALAVNSSDAVAVVDVDGRLTAESGSLSRMFGLPAATGCALAELVAEVGGDPATTRMLLARSVSQPGVPVELELQGRRPDGSPFWLGGRSVNLLTDPDVAGLVVSLHDITPRKLVEEELAHRAFYDHLTGLANRSLFLDHTEQALRRAGRTGSRPIVLCLDLDGFKDVNDSIGHIAGDDLLRTIAERLLGVVRTADTVARLGGDEFAVLIDDTVGGLPEAAALAERLIEVISDPVDLGGHRVTVGASIGIVVAEDDATPLGLFRDADIAMYRAKAAGRAQWVVFDPGMRAAALERIELERELSSALAEGQLRLTYQPVVNLQDEQVVGFEALLRWQHPTLGAVGPDRFVPVAEESGEIVPIGRWVLAEATRTAARWQRAHPNRPLSMAVNISARQLAGGTLLRHVAEALSESGLAPSSLVLEVTETALVTDPAAVAERLAELRALGVRLALDDFGTGYSSLSYLRQFHVDVLKIDRSFVTLLDGSADDAAIVHGLIQLGRTLRLEVVAEGVETTVQRDRLRAEHCDLAQGYLFARPLEVADAELLLLGQAVPTVPQA